MKSTYLIDANIVLRFLLGDHPKHSAKTIELFSRAEAGEFVLELTPITIAEVVWVLGSFHKLPRVQIADRLLGLLENPGISACNSAQLTDGLHRFQNTNLDFADCMLAAEACHKGKMLLSFDRDFRKFSDVKWLLPELL